MVEDWSTNEEFKSDDSMVSLAARVTKPMLIIR